MNYQTKLSIKKFEPSNIKKHRIFLLIGKRGTGKTTLMKDLIFNIKNYVDCVFAFSPTHDTLDEFKKFVPNGFVFDSFDTRALEKIVAKQTKLKEYKKKLLNIVILCDDCAYDKKNLATDIVRNIFMNGRHINITLIFAVQYLMDISPSLRTNIDYVFALRENIRANREKLHKYFFGCFSNFKDFNSAFEKTTSNNECIVLDNTTCSDNLNEQIYFYKAEMTLPKFKLGKECYWKLDKRYYKQKSEKVTNRFDDNIKQVLIAPDD